jgi:hypothetical protein
LLDKKFAEEIETLKESNYTIYAIKLCNDQMNIGVIDDADMSKGVLNFDFDSC